LKTSFIFYDKKIHISLKYNLLNITIRILFKKFLSLVFFLIFFELSYSQLNEKDISRLNSIIESAENFVQKDEIGKAANMYYKAGLLCFEKNDNKKAIPYLKEAAKLHGEIKEFKKVMAIYSNLGLLYANMDEYDKSLSYFQQSLIIRKNFGNQEEIASGLLDLSYVLGIQNNSKDAIINTIKALEISTEIKNSKLVLISYRMLAENYQKIGNEQKAAEYLDKYASYRQHFEKTKTEELVSEERIKSIAELSIKDAEARAKQLELELIRTNKELAEDTLSRKIKARDDSLALVQQMLFNDSLKIESYKKDKELARIQRAQEIADQRLYLIVLLGVTVLVATIAFGLLLINKRRKKHNAILAANNKKIADQNKNIEFKNAELSDAFQRIEEQNKDINSSIDYAVNIQKSLLPKQEDLNKYIEESFILFKPRDKVSGDFYWFKKTNTFINETETQKKIFISAIDCTGHGVPGAFLSMLSYNLLDDIVEQKRIFTPSEILNKLHQGVRKSLRQSETNNRDGMDMALCAYDPQKNILEYAGAKNPLIYIKEKKVHRLKGNVKPIGGIIHEKSEKTNFQNNTILIDSPITCYIFSDGFADQIGEETGRKLMTKYFRNLLTEIYLKPMKEQKDILTMFLKKWMGKTDQIDDILVIGFKINPNKI
jgi:serine phosphatase RsbU (regulator of sigma subunit)